MFNDMILAKDTYLEGGFKKNHNVVVLGTPGTGKTRHYILPNLCNMKNSSAVLLDPKGELYDHPLPHKTCFKKHRHHPSDLAFGRHFGVCVLVYLAGALPGVRPGRRCSAGF